MDNTTIASVFGPNNPANGTIEGPALVLGAVSEIGHGVVRSLLEGGRPVIAVAREQDALDTLRRTFGGNGELVPLVGSVDSENDGIALARQVARLKRPPTAAVAMLGGTFVPGRLLDHPVERLSSKLDEDLRPHLIAARHLLPVLAAIRRPATYLIVGGPAAESPWAGYGHLSVSAAALRSLAHVLNIEMHDTPVRVRQLSVCSPIRTDSNRDHACTDWPNAYEVGHRVAELLATPSAQPIAYLERRRPRPARRPNEHESQA